MHAVLGLRRNAFAPSGVGARVRAFSRAPRQLSTKRDDARPYQERRQPQPDEYLPEDATPAKWQRYAQLVAGTIGTGTFFYFVFFADFGPGEHCFRPVRVPMH